MGPKVSQPQTAGLSVQGWTSRSTCSTRWSGQLHVLPEAAQAKVQDLLQRTGRILTQHTKDKNKLYALHAPEVDILAALRLYCVRVGLPMQPVIAALLAAPVENRPPCC